LYYRWSKDFIEAGKRRLNGDTLWEANTEEVLQIKNENVELKNLVPELMLDNRTLKKALMVSNQIPQVYENDSGRKNGDHQDGRTIAHWR
jgi:hypothetical protein